MFSADFNGEYLDAWHLRRVLLQLCPVLPEADVLFGPEETRRRTQLEATVDGTALLEAGCGHGVESVNVEEK